MSKKSSHCPFYGVDEDICDVGCGYISPSDVSRIVSLCFGKHAACSKYGELLDRNNVSRHDLPSTDSAHGSAVPTGWRTDTTFSRHGLPGFGGTIFAIGLLLLDTTSRFWPLFIALGLFATGMLIWQGFRSRSGNPALVAGLQIPASLFFLSILSLLALPAFNLIVPPAPTTVIVYCVLWIMYSILAHSHLQRAQVATYGLPPTIILCALATLLYTVKPTAAATVAISAGLVVVGCIYLASALAERIGTVRRTSPKPLRHKG